MDSRDWSSNDLDDALPFRLDAARARVVADVQLRRAEARWIAIADASGRHVTGIGPTARAAVVASLSWLGAPVVSELLADPCLFDVSRRVLEAASA